jgi:putative hydrolase of the HAD superfamily
MFQAILFDLDNTLIDRQAAFRQYAIDFCHRRLQSLTLSEKEQALDEILAADDWGYRPRDQFCEWVAGLFPSAHLQASDIWQDCCRHLPSFIQPDSRVQAMLARLADRFRLFVVTNGSSVNQHEKLRRAGLFHAQASSRRHWFSEDSEPVAHRSANIIARIHPARRLADSLLGAIVSGEVGFEKPYLAIFERALAIAGCSADEALLVGDDPCADIAGAKQAGLTAYWVSLGRQYPCGVILPDRVLSSVLDLERWLV